MAIVFFYLRKPLFEGSLVCGGCHLSSRGLLPCGFGLQKPIPTKAGFSSCPSQGATWCQKSIDEGLNRAPENEICPLLFHNSPSWVTVHRKFHFVHPLPYLTYTPILSHRPCPHISTVSWITSPNISGLPFDTAHCACPYFTMDDFTPFTTSLHH